MLEMLTPSPNFTSGYEKPWRSLEQQNRTPCTDMVKYKSKVQRPGGANPMHVLGDVFRNRPLYILSLNSSCLGPHLLCNPSTNILCALTVL